MNKLFIAFIIGMITSKVGAQSSTFALADSLYNAGNYSKAIKIYESLPDEPRRNTQIAKAYKALGNSKKAIENYENVIRVDSLNTLVLYDYGKLLYTSGKLKKSLVVFERLKEKDSNNPNFHYHIGLVKESVSDASYITSYRTAFQLDSHYQKAIYKLIVNQLQHKDFEKAAKTIKIGLQNNEEDLKIIGFRAQLFYAEKQYRKALLWFEKLIDREKATQYVYEKAAFSAYRVGKILKAIAYYEEGLKKDPGNYFYHSQLAKLYYQDGILEKAEFHASQSIVAKMIDPSSDYYILGLVAFDQKAYKKAMKLFNIALEENPTYEAAQFQLALCADNYYEDLTEKLKMYELFLTKFPKAKSDMTKIVKTRIRELKEEIHLKSE